MKAVGMAIIALVSALSVLSTFPVLGAGRASLAASRDAAISRCLAQAHNHYPGKYGLAVLLTGPAFLMLDSRPDETDSDLSLKDDASVLCNRHGQA
jgi:uncharacterized membrane protein